MEALFNTTAGLLNEDILKIPNRRFMPDGLIQTVTTGKNLQVLGCRNPEIQGSSISFDEEQSFKGALGEFVERYASATYNSQDFLCGTYRELSRHNYILPLSDFRYYSDKQYRNLQKENICPLGEDDEIEWVKAHDYLTRQDILMPAFCIYMPYQSRIQSPHNYMSGSTSTGIAAGQTLKDAVISGFCECAERHAFAQFWYRQEDISYRQYTRDLILNHYHKSKVIRKLFNNPFVDLKVFDLSPFAPIETIIVFLYFRYKGFMYQSLGCAARFTKTEALTKACMEAYQGIEYAISLMGKKVLPSQMDLSQLDSFEKHFHFYNQYPECRQHIPILRQAQDFHHGDNELYQKEDGCRDFSPEELKRTGLKHLIFKDITPPDINDISYKVARVVTPTWSLLTGRHSWPFLGFSLNDRHDLFTQYPHPFP